MSQSDQQDLFDKIFECRHCQKIALGLTYQQDSTQAALSESMAIDPRISHSQLTNSRNRSSETATRVKLLSALACCQEDRRLTLGSLSMNARKGPWRPSDVNVQYDFCTR